MPLQGSGSISISELATEFGGQAPHSLSEYYKSAGLVPSQRAITGSESYTSLVTGDQIASTGIYVNGNTDSKTCTDATYVGQTIGSNGGDRELVVTSSSNSSLTSEDGATSITIGAGEYVNISIRAYMRYEQITISSVLYNRLLGFFGDGNASARRFAFDFRTASSGEVYTTGVEMCHEFTAGQSSDFVITNSTSKDLSAISRNNYTINTGNDGWQARPTKGAGNTFFDITIKGYASEATTIKMVAVQDFTSAQDAGALHFQGTETGTDPDDGGTYTSVTENSSITMNQFKAYNNNSYALSVNGTSIPANTPSGSAVLFADNLVNASVTASVTGNQPLNADVPTSGAISLTDFYSSEDE